MSARFFAGALAALAVGTPLSAEEPVLEAAAADDIQCAVWASYWVGTIEDDPETRHAFAYAMNFFLGRYEAGTGEDFRAAMTRTTAEADADPLLIDAYQPSCLGRWEEYLSRLNAWSEEGPAPADDGVAVSTE